MEYICVKLKQYEKNKYKQMLSIDTHLYSIPKLTEDKLLPYSPGALLDEGEWFYVNELSKQKYSIDIVKSNYSTMDMLSLNKKDFSKIDYLFVFSEDYLLFQNITKSKLIPKKAIGVHGDEYIYESNVQRIVINDLPDAIYDKNSDTLFFRKLESITGIFNGIDQLYREATNEETEQFLQNEFIKLKDDYCAAKVKTANRKRIALAIKTLCELDKDDKKNIISYIGEYCPELKVSENSFEIGKEDDMKKLLYGIEQRFYTTPVGGEKRIANSVILLK